MTRASNSEHAQRINAALALIKARNSAAEVARALAAQFGISRSQAYRYVREAEEIGKDLPIPKPKIAFTVKLSRDLIRQLRQYSGTTGKTLSDIVAQALEAFFPGGPGHD